METLYERITERHVMDGETIKEAALGLASEAGEVVQLVRKNVYDGQKLSEGEMLVELSDVLHYLVLACACYGITLEQLADVNGTKLKARDKGCGHLFDALMYGFSGVYGNFDEELAEINAAIEVVS